MSGTFTPQRRNEAVVLLGDGVGWLRESDITRVFVEAYVYPTFGTPIRPIIGWDVKVERGQVLEPVIVGQYGERHEADLRAEQLVEFINWGAKEGVPG